MQWKSIKNETHLIEYAYQGETRFEIRALKRTRLWHTYRNGILVDDAQRVRHNAKALVDKSIEPKEDLRKYNKGFAKDITRKPRRTDREIEIGKDPCCSRCGQRDKQGAVCSFQCVDFATYPDKKFSLCSLCLSDFVVFIQPIQRTTNGED